MNLKTPVFFSLLLSLCSTLAFAQVDENPHVRIIWGTHPSTSAVISVTEKNATLHFDTQQHETIQAYTNTLKPFKTGRYRDVSWLSVSDSDMAKASYAHFRLDNLSPSTKYHFVVEGKSGTSQAFYFITAPEDDRPFKLIYGGDSRSDPKARRLVNSLIKKKSAEDSEIIAFVHGGDYNGLPDSWSQWKQWLDDYEILVADDGRVYPIIPTRGNHEGGGVSYNHVFGFPAAEKTDYWSTPIGKLLWITLDSNVSHGGKQKAFLENELQRGQGFRWVVPSYHRPAYPAVKRPGNAYIHWVPLFEKYNVDFVAESDGHVLKRTVPIRDGQQSDDGIVYVGEGGLGVPQRKPDMSRWYLKPPGMAASGHHIQRLSFSKKQALYEAITLDGKVVDSYAFSPRNRGNKNDDKPAEETKKKNTGLTKIIQISPEELVSDPTPQVETPTTRKPLFIGGLAACGLFFVVFLGFRRWSRDRN